MKAHNNTISLKIAINTVLKTGLATVILLCMLSL